MFKKYEKRRKILGFDINLSLPLTKISSNLELDRHENMVSDNRWRDSIQRPLKFYCTNLYPELIVF